MARTFRGDRLKAAREASGLTQDELAQRLQTGPNQISRWELGKNEPTLETGTRLAKELGVTLDYLVGLVDEANLHLEEPALPPIERLILQAYRSRRFHKLFQLLFPDEPGNKDDAEENAGKKQPK